MDIGIFCAFSEATPPDVMVRSARAIEERGFAAIWVPEHVVLFDQYQSRYPYSEDGKLPGFRGGMMEPWTALAFMAGHTSRVRLGSSVCLIPQRNPVYTAKQVADVDFLSGGRVNFGIGLGWLREEYDALQAPWPNRAKRAREYVAVMQALWTQEVSEYRGELYTLPPCVQNPKPVQTPHPPMFFGGEGDPALTRVADLGQGWLGAGVQPEQMGERLARLDELLAERGRSRADIQVYVLPNRRATPELLDGYTAHGIDQVIQMVPLRDPDDAERRLDDLAKLAGN